MRVIGIDPGLTKTTLVLIKERERSIVARFKEFSTKFRGVRRLDWFYRQFVHYFDKHLVIPIFLEGYSFGAGRKGRLFDLGELGGVIKIAGYKRLSYSIVLIPPTVWKKYITGKGNASKALVTSVLASKYEISFDQQDQADALGIALTGLAILQGKTKQTRDMANKTEKLW